MADVCPVPLICPTGQGELTIAGWSLHTGAWCAWDLSELLSLEDTRGDNVLVESEAGRIARPVITDESEVGLPMLFSGAVTRLGTEYANPAGGLDANRRAFVGQLITPIRTGTASLAATLTVPDPTDPLLDVTLTADVQPLRLSWALHPNGYARAVLTMRVVDGVFAEAA